MTRRGLRKIHNEKEGLRKSGALNKAYVAIVLDRSSSMTSIRKETIDMFNEQVDAIKASETPTYVSLVTFSTQVDACIMLHDKARFLKKLKWSDYVPNGYTALNDALGDTLTEFMNHRHFNKPNSSFLIIVITDGEENMSSRYSLAKVKTLITEFEGSECGTVTYLGANVDVQQVCDDFGIKWGNAGVYCATSTGVRTASNSMRYATTKHLDGVSNGKLNTASFYVGTEVSLGKSIMSNSTDDSEEKK